MFRNADNYGLTSYEDNFDNFYDEVCDYGYEEDNYIKNVNQIKNKINLLKKAEQNKKEQKEKEENEKNETIKFKSIVSPLLNWVNVKQQPIKQQPLSDDFPLLSLSKNDDSWISVKSSKHNFIKKEEKDILSKVQQYQKTKMCSYITENKECPRKNKCTYAHFRNELIIFDCPYDHCKYVRIYNNKYQNTHRYYVCDRRHKNESDSNFFFRTKISDPVTEKEMQDTYDEFVYHYSLLTEQMKETINKLPCDKVIVFHGFMFNGNATASYKKQKIKEKIVLTKRWSDFVNTIKSEPIKSEPIKSEQETVPTPETKKESDDGWITVTIKTKIKPSEDDSKPVENLPKTKKRTQVCRSVIQNIKCPYGEKCNYAHTKKELNITKCGFGMDCKLIKIESEKYMNINKKKVCCYIHPSESVSEFYSRNNLN
jgi:hypothetical protein